jgi:hypothetical protein
MGPVPAKRSRAVRGAAVEDGEFADAGEEFFGLGGVALEEGVGADAEAQAVEGFLDGAGAFEEGALFGAGGAVDVGVDGEVEGVDEVFEDGEEVLGEAGIGGGGDELDHALVRVAGLADGEGAQAGGFLDLVEGGDVHLLGEGEDAADDFARGGGLEEALVGGEDVDEAAAAVEAEAEFAVEGGAEAEDHLVAVVGGLGRRGRRRGRVPARRGRRGGIRRGLPS